MELNFLIFPKSSTLMQMRHNALVYKAGESDPIKISTPIGKIEEILPKEFFRCHKSTIVNLSHRVRFLNKDNNLILTDDHKVIVAKDRLDEFYVAVGIQRKKKK
ncbi:MAG: LytTR family transcriptional regulator [Cyclobacteriaceae bacterium]|nr:LytTR family transcriptional regulator [Cyclobacteriaceae bacterium]